jgi:hypothetical protein
VINAISIVNKYRGITDITPEDKIQDMLNSIIETDEEG